jgi:hypothetical protein
MLLIILWKPGTLASGGLGNATGVKPTYLIRLRYWNKFFQRKNKENIKMSANVLDNQIIKK